MWATWIILIIGFSVIILLIVLALYALYKTFIVAYRDDLIEVRDSLDLTDPEQKVIATFINSRIDRLYGYTSIKRKAARSKRN